MSVGPLGRSFALSRLSALEYAAAYPIMAQDPGWGYSQKISFN